MPEDETPQMKIHRLKLEITATEEKIKQEGIDAFHKQIEERVLNRCFLFVYTHSAGKGWVFAKYDKKMKVKMFRSEEYQVEVEVQRVIIQLPVTKRITYIGHQIEQSSRSDTFKIHDFGPIERDLVRELTHEEFKRIWNMTKYVAETFLERALNPPSPPAAILAESPELAVALELDPESTTLDP